MSTNSPSDPAVLASRVMTIVYLGSGVLPGADGSAGHELTFITSRTMDFFKHLANDRIDTPSSRVRQRDRTEEPGVA